ncbi:ABC transporter substrate-binding protein [Arthrobacter cryoconiti]|uniref:ABC transporter substrate-binding protein n=1 Tax=Arthrobacter cryoconiti TaxID=748907 RepID=A0ABV8QZV1_9MICC|nr:ABC transporter substrate-binding protein [Arthrobacter cryoconiti]MCC9068573.1 ABC transporter substrate-binding protein [Arthrobacter cryoconiti]
MRRIFFTAATALSIGLAATVALSGCVVLRPGVSANAAGTEQKTAYTQLVELPTAIKDKGVLVIASQLASPPLIFQVNGSNAIEGINKDIADEVGSRLGVKIEWTQLPFAGLIPAVQSGKADAGMDLIGDTEQRRAAVDFANYMNQATSPLVRRGNPEGIHSVDDLCGLPVSIVRGGVQLELAEATSKKCVSEGKKPIQIDQYSAPGDARLSVQAGRDAAFLGNTPVMRYIAEQKATKSIFEMGGEATYQLQPIGIITAKGNPAVHDSIQSALDMMQADGSISKILKKWNTEDLALATPAKESK